MAAAGWECGLRDVERRWRGQGLARKLMEVGSGGLGRMEVGAGRWVGEVVKRGGRWGGRGRGCDFVKPDIMRMIFSAVGFSEWMMGGLSHSHVSQDKNLKKLISTPKTFVFGYL